MAPQFGPPRPRGPATCLGDRNGFPARLGVDAVLGAAAVPTHLRQRLAPLHGPARSALMMPQGVWISGRTDGADERGLRSSGGERAARKRRRVAFGRELSAVGPERSPCKLAPLRVSLGGMAFGRGRFRCGRPWHLGGDSVILRVAFGRVPADGAVEASRSVAFGRDHPLPLDPDELSAAGEWRPESPKAAPRPPPWGPSSPPQVQRFSPWHLDGTPWHLGENLLSLPQCESRVSSTYPVAFGRLLQLQNQLLLSTSSPPKCHIDRRTRLRQVSAGRTVMVAERAGR
jgi:hypothetical protein